MTVKRYLLDPNQKGAIAKGKRVEFVSGVDFDVLRVTLQQSARWLQHAMLCGVWLKKGSCTCGLEGFLAAVKRRQI